MGSAVSRALESFLISGEVRCAMWRCLLSCRKTLIQIPVIQINRKPHSQLPFWLTLLSCQDSTSQHRFTLNMSKLMDDLCMLDSLIQCIHQKYHSWYDTESQFISRIKCGVQGKSLLSYSPHIATSLNTVLMESYYLRFSFPSFLLSFCKLKPLSNLLSVF